MKIIINKKLGVRPAPGPLMRRLDRSAETRLNKLSDTARVHSSLGAGSGAGEFTLNGVGMSTSDVGSSLSP